MSDPVDTGPRTAPRVGDRVRESPVGPGVVTGFTPRGFPQVDHVAVAWLRLEDGRLFDPFNKFAPLS